MEFKMDFSPTSHTSLQSLLNKFFGFGYKLGKWDIDIFYIADFFHNRKIRNNILNGEYKNFMHITGVSIGYKF